MSSREIVVATLNHQPAPRTARELIASPTVAALRKDEVDEVERRYRQDFKRIAFPSLEWGLDYQNGQHSKYNDRQRKSKKWMSCNKSSKNWTSRTALESFQLPYSALEGKHWGKLNDVCEETYQFVLGESLTKPLGHLLELLGEEQLTEMLLAGDRDTEALIEQLHQFHSEELLAWSNSSVDAVVIKDQLGGTNGACRKIWQDTFISHLAQYAQILHSQDKFLFFQTNEDVSEIFDELVAVGVDAVIAPYRTTQLRQLLARHAGKVTFGVQHALEGTQKDLHTRIEEIREIFRHQQGGVFTSIDWSNVVARADVKTAMHCWEEPLEWDGSLEWEEASEGGLPSLWHGDIYEEEFAMAGSNQEVFAPFDTANNIKLK